MYECIQFRNLLEYSVKVWQIYDYKFRVVVISCSHAGIKAKNLGPRESNCTWDNSAVFRSFRDELHVS